VTFSVDVSEVNKLAVDLGKGSLRMVREAGKAVEKAVRDTQRDAKANAPVGSGRLRDSITSEVRGLTGAVGPTAFHGAYVEEGTSKMAPEPYLAPAMDKNTEPFVRSMGDIAKEILA
jgi:HK97 gp10 family phage protein